MLGTIQQILKKYWGFDGFLPLQKEAIECAVAGRDSIVVLPTGGGKSLCFQAPALAMPGLAVVVSPLIALMKDQVDSLAECGVAAARFDSTTSLRERNAAFTQARNGTLKLLYVAPERLVTDRFMEFLKQTKISLIAIDEAHCVSMWGHDFRPEYRALGVLKKAFPGVAVHAYTATATEPVRRDIADQLQLDKPEVLVGSFDRPNLVYKVERRAKRLNQVRAVLDRHKGASGIVYCIRRADVDRLCAELTAKGYRAAPYHAGMEGDDRKCNQEAFIEERVDTIVATIAFGMGIDKPNVRYVVHTGMPKSLEHYQQESGRAGRDGLEAECCLFFSGGDYGIWKSLMREMEPEAKEIAFAKLNDMYRYCTGVACRHRAILNYFGQDLDKPNCAACDVCLGDFDCMDDSLETAQKILSCVKRLRERFGADYTASVLTGSREQRILDNRHDALSTYGLLADHTKRIVRDWIEQLVAHGCVEKTGEFNVLQVTEKGWRVLKGTETPRLLKPAEKRPKAPKPPKVAVESLEGAEGELFEKLRELRRKVAKKKRIRAYMVFGDAALRDMARRKPLTPEEFLEVNGVGEKKCKKYAPLFLPLIQEHAPTDSAEAGGDASSDL